MSEAILAANLVGATPTETTSLSSSATRALIARAISSGGPNSRIEPATSRNASSTESPSTSGVKSLRIEKNSRDAASIRSQSCGRTIACGHRRSASAIGIAECTPYSRASYDAAATTPRSTLPPMRTALPRTGRIVALFERGEERVEVGVQNRRAAVVGHKCPTT